MFEGENGHFARPEGKLRAREWTRAARVVHGLTQQDNNSVGEVCSFDRANLQLADDDFMAVTGTYVVEHNTHSDITW